MIQANAVTDANGLRKVGEYFCIAISNQFGFDIGDKVIVVLEGSSFPAIISDIKQDRHTVDGIHGKDGSVVEFIVDPHTLNRDAKVMGSIGVIPGFEGCVVEIRSDK